MDKPHFLIVVGDASADRHAAALVDALRLQLPNVRITALGGRWLQQKADTFLFSLVGVGGFGFLEPLAKIPALWRVKQRILQLFKDDRPDLVIPMDYYGFNIHVAEAANATAIPVVYYISPQVWASRPKRVQRLAKAIRRMLVILPFEERVYQEAGVPVTYVGHPLIERLPEPIEPEETVRIGLLPGSRPRVSARHLPILAQAADRLRSRFPTAEFLLFRPDELPQSFYETVTQTRPWLGLVSDPDYQERRRLTLAIGVSGTASLENTLLGIPSVIMYRLSWMTYQIAKHLIQIPFVGMPNILAGREIVPELLQGEATPERIAAEAARLINNPTERLVMREALLGLRSQLKAGGSQGAAEAILAEWKATR